MAGLTQEIAFLNSLWQWLMARMHRKARVGVMFSTLCLDAAAACDGARHMFLIAVFGVSFSLLTLHRALFGSAILRLQFTISSPARRSHGSSHTTLLKAHIDPSFRLPKIVDPFSTLPSFFS